MPKTKRTLPDPEQFRRFRREEHTQRWLAALYVRANATDADLEAFANFYSWPAAPLIARNERAEYDAAAADLLEDFRVRGKRYDDLDRAGRVCIAKAVRAFARRFLRAHERRHRLSRDLWVAWTQMASAALESTHNLEATHRNSRPARGLTEHGKRPMDSDRGRFFFKVGDARTRRCKSCRRWFAALRGARYCSRSECKSVRDELTRFRHGLTAPTGAVQP